MATSSAISATASANISASGSKIGADRSDRSQIVQDSLYGNVKAPKITTDGPLRTTKTLEALRNKIKHDFLCGMGGVILALVLSAALFFCGVLAMRGKVLFLEIPNFKKLSKEVNSN